MYMYKNKFRMLRESLRHKRSFNLRLSEFAMKKRNVLKFEIQKECKHVLIIVLQCSYTTGGVHSQTTDV